MKLQMKPDMKSGMKLGGVFSLPALDLRARHLLALALALLVCLLLPLLMQHFGLPRARTMAAVLLGSWLLVLWCQFVSSLLRQNTPAAARLVPQHARRLRVALVGGWCALALLMVLPGRFVFQLELPTLLLALLALLALAWLTRWPQLWAGVWVLPAFSWLWLTWPPVQALGQQLRVFVQQQPLLATLGTLALVLALLPALVQRGDDAHRRRFEGRERQRQAARLVGDGAGGWRLPGWSAWLRRVFSAPYRAWLARLCGSPRSSVMARVMLVLGPSAHWTGQATGALLISGVVAVVLLVLVLLQVLPAPQLRREAVIGPAFGLMVFAINPLLQARTAMFRCRREQALLMLLPGLPRGAALNQALARRLMLHFFMAWAGAAAAALLLTQRMPAAAAAAAAVQASVWACLPCGLLLWRDWSRLRAPQGWSVLIDFVLVLLACALAVTLQRSFGLGPATLALASVGLTLALGAWRWRVLARVAPPWPAGRRARPGASA